MEHLTESLTAANLKLDESYEREAEYLDRISELEVENHQLQLALGTSQTKHDKTG